MPDSPYRVVFDCNVYFQSLVSAEGPAAKCIVVAARGEVSLFCSEHTLVELCDVARRSALRAKFNITEDRLGRLLETVREIAIFLDSVPDLYQCPRDPDDAHYVNLALAATAKYVVSRDHDLLALMDISRPEGRDFRRRFPSLEIIEPQTLIRELSRTKM